MLGEAVIGKQCVEHGFGNHVLRQHFDDFFVADSVVEVIAQFCGKGFKGGAFGFVGRVF